MGGAGQQRAGARTDHVAYSSDRNEIALCVAEVAVRLQPLGIRVGVQSRTAGHVSLGVREHPGYRACDFGPAPIDGPADEAPSQVDVSQLFFQNLVESRLDLGNATSVSGRQELKRRHRLGDATLRRSGGGGSSEVIDAL